MNPAPVSIGLGDSAHSARAFTLIELLTVIAIIGILAAILIPTVGKVREQARLTQSLSNLRQVGTAMTLHAADNKDELPGRRVPSGFGLSAGVAPAYFHQDNTSDRLNYHLARYTDTPTIGGGEKVVKIFDDPLIRAKSNTDSLYAANWALNTVLVSYGSGNGSQINPFGTGAATPPQRLTALQSKINAGRVWAMIHADQQLPSVSTITAPTVAASPALPVGGAFRLALFFDWSVAKVPLDAQLRNDIAKKL